VDAVRAGNEGLAKATTYTHIESGRGPSIDAMRHLLIE
jgi:hypothetical protein